VLKKTIKTIIKICAAASSFALVLFLGLSIWIYTGPHSVPFLAKYITNTISGILPKNINVSIGDVLVSNTNDFAIRLKLEALKVSDETRGDFSTNVSIILDPEALFPQTHKNLLNIEIDDPSLVYNKFKQTTSNEPIPVQEINEYLNLHKEKLLKFSLSLTNTNFEFNISGRSKNDREKAAIYINEMVLKPTLINKKLLFTLYGDFNIGGKNNILKATLDTSSNKHLSLKGTFSNLSNFTLNELGIYVPELKNANIQLDLNFMALLRGSRSVEYIEFEANNFNGWIRENAFFNKDIKITDLQLKGYCNNNCQLVNIEKFSIEADKLNLKSSAEYKLVLGEPTLTANFQLDPITVDMVDYYWPKSLATRTRDWIFSHIKGGTLKSTKGYLNLNFNELSKKKLTNSKIDINVEVANTSVRYLDDLDPVTNVDSSIHINLDDITFVVKKGILLKTTIESASGSLNNLSSSKSSLTVDAKVSGSIQDLIDLSFKHAEVKNDTLKNVTGTGIADVKVSIPIREEDLELKDIKINAKAQLSDTGIQKIYKNIGLSKGKFDVTFDNFIIDVQGAGVLNNRFDADISGEYKLLKDFKELKVKTRLNWDSLTEFDIEKINFANNNFDLILNYTEHNNTVKSSLTADLRDSTINHAFTGIKKKIGEPGFLKVSLNAAAKNSVYDISDYYLSLPELTSKGSGKISSDFAIQEIRSSYTKFGQGEFRFDLLKNASTYIFLASGSSFDLAKLGFNSKPEPGTIVPPTKPVNPLNYEMEIKVGKIHMKNGQHIINPIAKAKIENEAIKELKIAGNMGGGDVVNLNVKYPVVSLVSNNAGKAMQAFGATNKIEGGSLNLHGKLSGKDFDGKLEIDDYRMLKTPFMANIISIFSITTTSLEGFSNIFTNRGVKFDKLRCPITLKSGMLIASNCYAKGPSLTFTADGFIDFNKDQIKIKGTVVPENILNSAISNIPLIGSAFNSKKGNSLIGASYTISGTIDDPKTSSNPLSILAPGVLREAF
jgi:hypothetical protein